MSLKILDCTLRDGGYYNHWNFPADVVADYLEAMAAAGVDIVELGMRSLINNGFKGAAGYTTDIYLAALSIPSSLKVAVMVNASELLGKQSLESCLDILFPLAADKSTVDMVRIACHVHEFEDALPAATWLKARGYMVGFNLMQVAERSQSEVEALARAASQYELDTLYFADSMGSMSPDHCRTIIGWLRTQWKGELGIHTHDNMGLALANTLAAAKDGVLWLDATVTGMGRGPGNARTEELVIEVADKRHRNINMVPLLSVIRRYFQPLKNTCGWGSNPYYYLSGKHGIHPTYIQEMLSDTRFDEEDIIAAIEHLKVEGGKKFSFNALDATRHFYRGESLGTWAPQSSMSGRDVLIVGAGSSVREHAPALEQFIEKHQPIVIALNTESTLPQSMVDIRVASHPVRLLADCEEHVQLPQPLVTPASMLPDDVLAALDGKKLQDFGMQVSPGEFICEETRAKIPNSLVISYALAICASGQANTIYLAGFDGFGPGDRRSVEMQKVFNIYHECTGREPISITPTDYDLTVNSVYGF